MKRLPPSVLKGSVPILILGLAVSFFTSRSFAVPSINSVAPSRGLVGQDVDITIKGTGLTAATRVIIAPDSGDSLKIIGSSQYIEAGLYASVEVVCNTAYVLAGYSLQIFDVMVSTFPVPIQAVSLPSYGMNITVRDGIAYVLTERNGLLTFDVSNPAAPIQLGEVHLSDQSRDIVVTGNLAFVADNAGGLKVIDVADPGHPEIIGQSSLSFYATGIDVSGNFAYVVDQTNHGLRVFDVSNPAEPVNSAFVATPGILQFGVSVAGQSAFVADWDAGLQVIDVSNPKHPAIIGTVNTPGFAERVAVANNRAYLTTRVAGLQVIDVSMPNDPKLVTSVRTPYAAYGVAIANNVAYVAAGNLEIIDISNSTPSTLIGNVPTSGETQGVALVGSTAYVADYDTGLQVIDISDPIRPVVIGTVAIPGHAMDVDVQGTVAYVAAYDQGLQVVDVSDRRNPVVIGAVTEFAIGGYWAYDVEVHYGIAYVAAFFGGLQLIDVSEPTRPVCLGHIETRVENGINYSTARDLVVVGSIAYVADQYAGLCVVDISNPYYPTLIASLKPPGGMIMGIAVSGSMAYLAQGFTGDLHIINISNPYAPVLISSLGFQEWDGWDISVADNIAYVATNWQGVQVFDVSDPYAPLYLTKINSRGEALDLAVADDMTLVADGDGGLSVAAAFHEVVPLPPSPPGTELTATVHMNFPGDYTVRVFDDTGGSELPGAITLLAELPKSKAVIVAGYGPHPTNKLWDETLLNANYAWSVLVDQGYLKENIRYLNPVAVDVDNNGTPDVYGEATLAELQNALTSWAADADDLILYLVGHGSNKSFVMRHTDTVHEELAAGVLAGWLNTLQNTTHKRAVTVYEACYSGSFVDPLQLPAGASYDRMVLTSSSSSQVSILGNQGLTSFSHRFWESVLEQGELVQAFTAAAGLMNGFGQVSWLDGNCDGVPNTPADSSGQTVVGRGYNFQAPLKPYVSCANPDLTLRNTNTASLWARTVSAHPVSRVWAEIIPPDYNPLAPDAQELTTVELNWSADQRRYEATYPQFVTPGTYHVAFYARDDQQVVSLPRVAQIRLGSFPWSLFLPVASGKR